MKNFNWIEILCKPEIMWDWFDFGVMLRFYKNSKHSNYYISLDVQIAWLNLWIQIFKKSHQFKWIQIFKKSHQFKR